MLSSSVYISNHSDIILLFTIFSKDIVLSNTFHAVLWHCSFGYMKGIHLIKTCILYFHSFSFIITGWRKVSRNRGAPDKQLIKQTWIFMALTTLHNPACKDRASVIANGVYLWTHFSLEQLWKRGRSNKSCSHTNHSSHSSSCSGDVYWHMVAL